MMRLKYMPLGFLILSLLSVDGCKKKHRTQNPTLNPADNVAVSGQTVTLTNNSTSQTNGFSLTFSNVGNLTCNDVSIVTTAAYAFVPNTSTFLPSPVETAMPQYTCVKTGSNIVLSSAPPLTEGFHPWIENFNILLGTTTFNITVNTPAAATQLLTRGNQPVMNLDSSFTGCGLRGTVLQRVFDCSKKIINYGATVTDSQSACGSSDDNPPLPCGAYYTPFANGVNSDPYWFVVSCPNTGGSSIEPQQSCSWLTPIVTADQPSLDTHMTIGNIATFTLTTLTGYQKRLLWGGKMTNGTSGYNFAAANGFTEPQALVYDPNTTPSPPNPGDGASGAVPTPTPASVCTAAPNTLLNGGGTFGTNDASIRDLVSLTTGATISWQMSSYAMQNILTGGTTTAIGGGNNTCPAIGSGQLGGRPYCDMPSPSSADNQGFNAINVPGFSQTTIPPTSCFATTDCLEITWSSSSNGSGYAWEFVARGVSDGGYVFSIGPTALLGVRCVSPAWY